MKKLIIIGAGGFGREVAWLVERINKQQPVWDLVGFIDDNPNIQGSAINGYTVIGTTDAVTEYPEAYYVCAVGASRVREKIIAKITGFLPAIRFATLVDPSVLCSDLVSIGEGSIICAHSIITVNITMGNHVIIDVDCTIGHDAVLEDFVMLYPSVNISGNTHIGRCTELGTGTQIIQGKCIGSNSIVGAGAVVVKDIPEECTAVGSPAKPIKFFK